MISITFSLGSILVGDHTMKMYLCCVREPSLCLMIYCPTAWFPKIGPPPCMTTCPSRLTSLWHGGPFRPKCCTSTLLDFHRAFYCLQTNRQVYFPALVNLAWSGSGEPTVALPCTLHFSLTSSPLPLSYVALFGRSSQERLRVPVQAPIGFYDGVDRLQSASFSTGDRCLVTQSCCLAIPSQKCVCVHVCVR